jgi:hypothetical protein
MNRHSNPIIHPSSFRLKLIALVLALAVLFALLGFAPFLGFSHFTAVEVGTWQRYKAQTAVTVTQNGTINPTGTYQPVSAAAAVSTGSIAAGTAGDLLILEGTDDTKTVTISDTGTLKLGGNRALGADDTLTLLSDGTNWIELSFVNN